MGWTPDDGGPAFPACNEANMNDTMGMSLRDHFAGQALASIIAVTSAGQHQPDAKHGKGVVNSIAIDAYEMADAMLAARKGGA